MFPSRVTVRMKVISAACLMLVLAGCSATKRIVVPAHRVALDSSLVRLYETASDASRRLETLTATADLEVESRDFNKSFGSSVRLRRTGEVGVQISVTALLGIKVAETYINADSIFVHNIFQNEFILGRNLPETLRQATRFDLSFRQLLDLSAGVPSLPPLVLDSTFGGVQAAGSLVTYRVANASFVQRTTLDTLLKTVTGIQVADTSGKVIYELTYDDFQSVQNQMLPAELTFASYLKPDGSLAEKPVQ
jgi:hypothetical protein